jgi:hypothetical protein
MQARQIEIERFLSCGEIDIIGAAWPGQTMSERARHCDADLRDALVAAVSARSTAAVTPREIAELDLVAFTRAKVAPMVRGLFPANERDVVLDVLCRSVVFLTHDAIEDVLRAQRYLRTAWQLANLYMASCGAPMLSDDAVPILGLSQATTCYVSMGYFKPANRLAAQSPRANQSGRQNLLSGVQDRAAGR